MSSSGISGINGTSGISAVSGRDGASGRDGDVSQSIWSGREHYRGNVGRD